MSVGVFWRPCALQGSPERGRVENVNKKVVRGSSPGPPKSTQKQLKSIEISRYVCVSASECVFYDQGVAKGGWICSNHNEQHGLGTISCFGNLVFFLFLGLFWASFLLIWGSLDDILVVRKLMQILIEKPGRK